MRLVQITVTADGRVEMSTFGFPGKACIESVKFLKELLGEETFIKLKPSAFVQVPLPQTETVSAQ